MRMEIDVNADKHIGTNMEQEIFFIKELPFNLCKNTMHKKRDNLKNTPIYILFSFSVLGSLIRSVILV